ncbi:MAG TPA: CBS domain-containing protein [Candidatus Omnitrophica bacterium]|nr:CBS domain-containing protein [Candidatus Omnitrophota bacterium]
MKGSFKILRIFSIDIEIHISFLILPLFFFFLYGIKGVFIIAAIFTCVAAHELTHSLVAKSYGIRVARITLLPIGGIAAISSVPQNPKQELAISISGPMFNIALTLLLYLPLRSILGSEVLMHPNPRTWSGAIAYAYWVNPILAGFNLLPAFPMDGGRILRSLLALKFTYKKATRIAVVFGYIFAVIFAFIALSAQPPNFLLLLIALFIFSAASQEEAAISLKYALNKIRVKDILPERSTKLVPQTLISEVINIMLHIAQEDFPVLDDNGNVVGLLTRESIALAVQNGEEYKTASDLMIKEFPRITSQETLSGVFGKIQNSSFKAIPVIDNGSFKGMVTLEDVKRIYALFAKEKGR